jgi:heme/copper-type cytochrome/quinol oxidase subunit 1
VLSFTVWLHHFFTMGQSANINAVFGIASMLIGIPTGVKIYDWMWTMFRGPVRFTVPMVYSIGFILLFVLGGMSGILLANPTVDYQVHNTVFLVAHFHNVAVPGVLFGMIAAYHFWFPKAFGFRLNERWGIFSALMLDLRLHAGVLSAVCAGHHGSAATHRGLYGTVVRAARMGGVSRRPADSCGAGRTLGSALGVDQAS